MALKFCQFTRPRVSGCKRNIQCYIFYNPRDIASAWKHAGAGRQMESFWRENGLLKELMCSSLLYIVNKLYHKNFPALFYISLLFLSFLITGVISSRVWKNQFPSLKTFVHRRMGEGDLLKDNCTICTKKNCILLMLDCIYEINMATNNMEICQPYFHLINAT